MSMTIYRLPFRLALAISVATASLHALPLKAYAHEQKTEDEEQRKKDKQSSGFEDSVRKDHDTIKADTKVEQQTTGDTAQAGNNKLPSLPTNNTNASGLPSLPTNTDGGAAAAALGSGDVSAAPAAAGNAMATTAGNAAGGMDLSSLAGMAKQAMTGMAMMQMMPMLGGMMQSVMGMIGGGGGGGGSGGASSGGAAEQGTTTYVNLPAQMQQMPLPDASSYVAARGTTGNILYSSVPQNQIDAATTQAITALRAKTLEASAVDAYGLSSLSKNEAGNAPTLAAKLEGCASASSNIRTDWQCNTSALGTMTQQTSNITQILNGLLEVDALAAIAADPRLSNAGGTQ